VVLFSVIIPTYNRIKLLEQCLNCLAPGAQTVDPSTYEVIVTDDSELKLANELIEDKFKNVIWVGGPKRGPAANRNNGVKYAKGEWLVFTDDDCLPDTKWLEAYRDSVLRLSNCEAYEGSIYPDNWELLKKDLASCPVNTKGGAFWSANIMIRKTLFIEVGGFDEQFEIAAQEDQDLYLRLKSYTPIPFISASAVVHPVRFITLRNKLLNIDKSIINWYKFYRKYNTPVNINIRRNEAKKHFKLSIKNFFMGNLQSCVFHLMNVERYLFKSSLFE
jgi:glycosyltransferase involved in cell wall biosynthesis